MAVFSPCKKNIVLLPPSTYEGGLTPIPISGLNQNYYTGVNVSAVVNIPLLVNANANGVFFSIALFGADCTFSLNGNTQQITYSAKGSLLHPYPPIISAAPFGEIGTGNALPYIYLPITNGVFSYQISTAGAGPPPDPGGGLVVAVYVVGYTIPGSTPVPPYL